MKAGCFVNHLANRLRGLPSLDDREQAMEGLQVDS